MTLFWGGCQIVVYLERIFNLLGDANVAKQTLVQLGDGLNQEEQQVCTLLPMSTIVPTVDTKKRM